MTTAPRIPDWIAVDWGTSSLRVFAMADDKVLAEAQSDRGMGTLDRADYEGALLELIAPWLGSDPVTIVACGMVGAQQGWAEAPYSAVPTTPLADAFVRPLVQDSRLKVHIIPGLCQNDPADVMRGEETQIAGYIAENPDFDGVLCLPGTHTKWVQISAEEVVSFRTFMTGELFAILSRNSVLRHSVGDGFDPVAFDAAVSETLSRPEQLAARLFGIRAGALLADLSPNAGKGRLSGLLIGAELAATKPYWLGQKIVLIGAPELSKLYARALESQGALSQIANTAATTLAGLTKAHSLIKETVS